MTRTLAVLCALALGASADAALSANDSIPLPRARSDGIGTTVPPQAQDSANGELDGRACRSHTRPDKLPRVGAAIWIGRGGAVVFCP